RMLGGAMRQAGVIAAAGIVAVERNVPRLADDHANARLVAETLSGSPHVLLDLDRVETNIVVLHLADGAPDAAAVVAAARERGVLVLPFGPRTIRAVTHLDVDRDACGEGADALVDAIASLAR
ncbi:MAG: beta-eliminating lyase-related protein, partial [Thermoleophilia bacterium]|nr:beta-eliminating lyase-related protein [Thermoleophilia bacterium]